MAKTKEFTKIKKKEWVEIYGTKQFDNIQLGESFVSEPTSLMNRFVKVNLMVVTRDIKKQNTNGFFRINEIKEHKAFAKFVGFERIPASIKRFVRRKRNKIESSIKLTSMDNVNFVIKPLVITNSQVSRTVSAIVRRKMNDILADHAKKTDFDTFVGDILNNKIQKFIKDSLTKTSPLKIVEIRVLKEVLK